MMGYRFTRRAVFAAGAIGLAGLGIGVVGRRGLGKAGAAGIELVAAATPSSTVAMATPTDGRSRFLKIQQEIDAGGHGFPLLFPSDLVTYGLAPAVTTGPAVAPIVFAYFLNRQNTKSMLFLEQTSGQFRATPTGNAGNVRRLSAGTLQTATVLGATANVEQGQDDGGVMVTQVTWSAGGIAYRLVATQDIAVAEVLRFANALVPLR